MRLTLLYDHRFFRDAEGVVFSQQNYNYPLFAKRYLSVFDGLRIVARVDPHPRPRPPEKQTEGPGVELISLGDWHGPVEYLRRSLGVRRKLRASIPVDSAVIMICPGVLGSIARGWLVAAGRPYGAEVISDPWDLFGPGAVRHPLRPVFRRWFSRQLRQQCRDASTAQYVTQFALQRRYPCAGESFGVSDVDLPEEALAAEPRGVRREPRPITLVTVSTLAQMYKAVDVLIDAVGRCLARNVDLRLVLIGDGKHRAELEARAAARGLGDRVRFLGQLPAGAAVRAELDRADVFMLASRQEGLPRAMVEAMARGLPCIGSTVGGIPELLPAEDMVPAGDVAALEQKICEVAADPERLARMSARNLQTARNYREAVLTQRRTAFYRSLKDQTQAWLDNGRR